MQNSSAGILMKSLKKQTPKRPFWFCLAHTADRRAVFALLSGRAPPGAGLWQPLLWEPHCEINYREKCWAFASLHFLHLMFYRLLRYAKQSASFVKYILFPNWERHDRHRNTEPPLPTTQAPACLMEIFVRLKLCRIALMNYDCKCSLQSGGHSLSEISR